jgi:predicted DNA-binding transcriptional regulator
MKPLVLENLDLNKNIFMIFCLLLEKKRKDIPVETITRAMEILTIHTISIFKNLNKL